MGSLSLGALRPSEPLPPKEEGEEEKEEEEKEEEKEKEKKEVGSGKNIAPKEK